MCKDKRKCGFCEKISLILHVRELDTQLSTLLFLQSAAKTITQHVLLKYKQDKVIQNF